MLCFRKILFFVDNTVDILLEADIPDLSLDQKRTTSFQPLFIFGPRTENHIPQRFPNLSVEITVQQCYDQAFKRSEDDIKEEVDCLERFRKLAIFLAQNSAEIDKKKNSKTSLVSF